MANTTGTIFFKKLYQQKEFLEVPTSFLRLDTHLAFDIYLSPENGIDPPVLYRNKNLPFTKDVKQRLIHHDVKTLSIPTENDQSFYKYIENNIGDILTDPDISIEQRAWFLYESAQNMIHSMMKDPRSSDMLQRSSNIADHAVHFMFKESNAFKCLLKVTSYDYYTYTHSVNVFVFSTALAHALGHSENEVRVFGQGTLLHDIGKSMIDPAIIRSREKLTPAQWHEIKQHPVLGHRILLQQGFRDEIVLFTTRHHHEKLDGTGYPDGLKGNEITHWARICAIADVFDAMTSKRTYKDAHGSFETLKVIRDEMRTQVDRHFLRVFIQMMGSSND